MQELGTKVMGYNGMAVKILNVVALIGGRAEKRLCCRVHFIKPMYWNCKS